MTLPCPTCAHHRGIDDQGTYICSAGGPETDQFPLADAWIDRIMRQGCPGWAQGKAGRKPRQAKVAKPPQGTYYQRHRDILLARSKNRYRTNPEYRARQKARSKAQTAARKK